MSDVLYTVNVRLSFEVPGPDLSDASARKVEAEVESLLKQRLQDLPFDPIIEVSEAYTWHSFRLAPKAKGDGDE